MDAKEFAEGLGEVGRGDGYIVFNFVANHVRDLQLPDGRYLRDVSDHEAFWRQVALHYKFAGKSSPVAPATPAGLREGDSIPAAAAGVKPWWGKGI